jgi:hypothetical protein
VRDRVQDIELRFHDFVERNVRFGLTDKVAKYSVLFTDSRNKKVRRGILCLIVSMFDARAMETDLKAREH